MCFKKLDPHLSFADIALFNSLNRNRAIKKMGKINSVVNWSKIESLVVRGYSANEPVSIHSFFRMVQKSSARPFRTYS